MRAAFGDKTSQMNGTITIEKSAIDTKEPSCI